MPTIPQKTILLVHSMSPGKKFIYQRLKKMNLRVVCLAKDKAAWGEPYVDHWILADLASTKQCIAAVTNFMRDHQNVKLGGVVTFWDEAVMLTSSLVDAFGFIGIPYEVAKRVKNKYLFRDFCAQNGIKAPRHLLLKSKSDIPALEKKLKYPLVVKPIFGVCSAYVLRVNNRAELEETYSYIRNNIKHLGLAEEWENFELMIEEFIDGDEVDIDMLLQNGKVKFHSVADNFNKTHDRFFVDTGQAVPSGLPEKAQRDLVAMAEETLEKAGVENGCIHFEAKIAPDGAYPIEVNMRMGGDYVYSYIKSAWGVDMVEAAVHIALGEYIKIDKPEVPFRYVAGWDFQVPTSGVLAELDVSPMLKDKSYFEEIFFFYGIGDAILRPPEGYDRLGWLTVAGDNLIDAQDNLQDALRHINYKIVEFDDESSLGKTARDNPFSAAVVKKNFILQAAKLAKVRQLSLSDQRQLHVGVAGTKSHVAINSSGISSRMTAKSVQEQLTALGYKTTFLDINNLSRSLYDIRESDIDLVFNAAQEIGNNRRLKSQVAALFESVRLPFTGSSSFALTLCRDKVMAKKILAFHKVPTPKWDYICHFGEELDKSLQFPLIVKPSQSDNSFGITNDSVVTTAAELEQQLRRVVVDLKQTALVEEYIEGDEYEVSILGNNNEDLRVLPLYRSVFTKLPPGYWHIYTQEARRTLPKPYHHINIENPVKRISPKLEKLVTEIAIDAYRILHCQDYGRVGIRVDKDGNPYVLEVDPNPILHEESDFAKSAKLTKLKFGNLLETIISLSLKRVREK